MTSLDVPVAAGPSGNPPTRSSNLYHESLPLLYASTLVYAVANVLADARKGKAELEVPEGYPLTKEDLKQFSDKSCDLRAYNNGKGLSFGEISQLFETNEDAIMAGYGGPNSTNFRFEVFEFLQKFGASVPRGIASEKAEDQMFLSIFRSIQSRVSCVYGVIKDVRNKRIIVAFRGSQSKTRDWPTNINFRLEALPTPERIKDKMSGNLKTRILVHDGFYHYLNENEKLDERTLQRYERIMEDVESLMEDGYDLCVTGHSLGGALATLFAFQIAGEESKYKSIPRPITLISYAAPFSGTGGYRKAFEQMELDGLIRSLRVNVNQDLVPSLWPHSLGFKLRTMKHTGINLRLYKNGYKLTHSSTDGFFNLLNKCRNSLVKPIWWMMYYHDLKTYEERFKYGREDLVNMSLDELYEDPKIVGKKFLKSKLVAKAESGEMVYNLA